MLLLFGTFNRKRIDLSKGSAMNYQGTSASQFLIMIPLMVFPILLHWPFRSLGIPNIGLVVIGGLGVVGLLSHRYILRILVQQFEKQKYKMAQGFRQ